MRQLFTAHALATVLGWMLWGAISASDSFAADWPTYRGNSARSGTSAETIRLPLKPRWIASAPGIPQLSRSSAEGRVMEGHLMGHRAKYDDAIHPVVVGNRVFFGSSVDHQLRCVDLLLGPNDQPATYTVRLHFAGLGSGDREPIVFDVQLQGKTALEDVTLPFVPPSQEGDAGGRAAAIVRDVENVRVTDNLVLDLVAKQGRPRLCAIEVVRTDAGK